MSLLRVFDTSFVIDLSNSDSGAMKLANIVDNEGSVAAISVISVHEYLLGIHLRYFLEKKLLAKKLETAERELSAFMILPLTQEIAIRSAEIHASLAKSGRIIGINDLYIAATAVIHEAAIVTRNSREFEQVRGLSVERY